tara:strand:+ start:817 stop:1230 length:414 start_codon:yes stop_codon:yes gene_type:complete
MITITLTENCGIKAGGLDIYASGIRKISCPANLNSGREVSSTWNIPFNWCYGEASEWKAENTVILSIKDGVNDEEKAPYIMGQDFKVVNDDGTDKYVTSNGGQTGLKSTIYVMSNYSKQIIEEYFPNIGTVEVTFLS